jgi:hypothetical protein
MRLCDCVSLCVKNVEHPDMPSLFYDDFWGSLVDGARAPCKHEKKRRLALRGLK